MAATLISRLIGTTKSQTQGELRNHLDNPRLKMQTTDKGLSVVYFYLLPSASFMTPRILISIFYLPLENTERHFLFLFFS